MAIHHGCYFHYFQSLYKQIQQLGLSTAYLEDEIIRLFCRSTMALALLPIQYVEDAAQLVKNDAIPEMGDFFKYFRC